MSALSLSRSASFSVELGQFTTTTAMLSILSLALAALVAANSSVLAETTVGILEFGPGGSVHRTTSSVTESNPATVSSLWNALHRPSVKQTWNRHAGVSIVPDLFTAADSGIIIWMKGEGLKSMPTTMSLLDVEETMDNVVGHIHVPGQAGADLMKRVSASAEDLEIIPKDLMSSRLQTTAENAALGAIDGVKVLSLAVDSADAAEVADEQIGLMLKALNKQAVANKKTVVLHLVVEESTRRRLEGDDNEEGENQGNNNAYAWNEKTIYEIQTFNLYLWTSVGIFVILAMTMRAFVGMPLMPDTLLFGQCKMGAD